MRVGLVTSTVLHAALLGYGLLALAAPPPLEVADVEAFPVEIVPVDEIARIQLGDRKAPAAEKPAPIPTIKPDAVPDAKEIGNNSVDLDSPPTPQAKPQEVKETSQPKASPEPAPRSDETPGESASRPEPVPATERTPQEQPRQEVKPDPAPETAVAESADAEAIELPQNVPTPQARPEPPQAQTAKAPERKDSPKPARQQAQQKKANDSDPVLDQVAALIDQRAPSGGGAKRSEETAALGGRKTTEVAKLTQSEEDALRQQLGGCWLIDAGIMNPEELAVSVRFSLTPDGRLDGVPKVEKTSGNAQFDRSAVRAVQKCDIQGLKVPADKYETWAEVVVNFDLSGMF